MLDFTSLELYLLYWTPPTCWLVAITHALKHVTMIKHASRHITIKILTHHQKRLHLMNITKLPTISLFTSLAFPCTSPKKSILDFMSLEYHKHVTKIKHDSYHVTNIKPCSQQTSPITINLLALNQNITSSQSCH
jgi:hypothetical protein